MLNTIFQPVFTGGFTIEGYLTCLAAALVMGLIVAAVTGFRTAYSKSFLLTLILLPAVVQTVIMLVNGSIGTGIAVMGAFSLIRFRSEPGNAREIVSIFIDMAIGLALATGYIGVAAVFTVVVCAAMLLISAVPLKNDPERMRELKMTIPESLNYAHEFDDLFDKYTRVSRLVSVKTTNMGSLYKLRYIVAMKDADQEQEFIDALRCRNGNLEISLGIAADSKERL